MEAVLRKIPVIALLLSSFAAFGLSAQTTRDPRRTRALMNSRDGERALQAGNFDEAASLFRGALELDPDLTLAHCGLGHAFMGLKQYPRAVEAFVSCREAFRRLHELQARDQASGEHLVLEEIQALRDSISRLDAGGIKQVSTFERERIEQRIHELELRRRAGRDEKFVTPAALSLSLGSAYLRQGLLTDAEREYRAALLAKPDFGEAHNNLAAVLLRTGRAEEAEQEASQAERAGYAVSAALKADIGHARAGTLPAPAPAPAPAPPAAAPSAPDPEPAGTPLSIVHEALDCVMAGKHPVITAQVAPADGASAVRVRFTTAKANGWFTVSMGGAQDRRAVLPAPKGALRRFRYQIEAIGVSAEKAFTPEHTVEVVGAAGDCAGRRVAETVQPANSLIVEGPPDVRSKRPPLVPSGFSSRMVAGQVGVFELSSPVAVMGGILAGAGMVAAAMAASNDEIAGIPIMLPLPPNNELSFLGSNPPPGSTISLAAGALSMSFRVTMPSDIAAGSFTVSLYAERFGPSCVSLRATHAGFRVGEPQTLVATGPFVLSPVCGSSFTTFKARAFLFDSLNRLVLSTASLGRNPSVHYSFVP